MILRRISLIFLFLICLMSASTAFAQFGLQEGDDITLSTDANATDAQPQLVFAAPDSVAVGEPFAVRITSTKPLNEVVIYWQGKEVMPAISVWNDKHVALALLGTDVLNAEPGKQELVVTASIDNVRKTYKKNVVVADKKFPRQDLTLPKKMVTPPKEVYDRIARESKVIAEARDTISPERMWKLPFQRPVDGDVTSVYGLRRYLNKQPKNPHRGMDFRAPKGTVIKSVADGKVVLVGEHYYAGNSVYIDHGNGVVSMYFHLSKVSVKEGETVERGQLVGLSGSTGRATGAHLHLSVAVLGKLVDPAPLFAKNVDQLLK
ncbi:M23 family metallopeptidase [Salidesulfovibrio onnuriiensis]|uniref:M23 family metallopeptidase n=1 Tax=Salidesulfovibrio onnuriiensis TaxID=2583823 RepID=UPI0011CBD97D|nr:M23 family metallopeptidase [Salidesulfovibrio onnuriiensis]